MTAQVDPSYPLIKKRHSIDVFVCTVIISLILHLAASTVLLLPGRYSVTPSAQLFVDLKSMTSPVEPPVQEPQPLEDPAPPQSEPVPETAPEAAKMEKAIDRSLQRAAVTPEAIHESSIGLGMISGHFASFSEGESLKDDIRVYYFEFMRRINEFWWMSGAAKGTFTSAASVNLSISRDGKVVACELLESSGNWEQDKALLDAIKKAQPLPPLPKSFYQQTFNAPIRFVPPLRLMFPGFGKKLPSPH